MKLYIFFWARFLNDFNGLRLTIIKQDDFMIKAEHGAYEKFLSRKVWLPI